MHGASATIGTATGTVTYGMGTGATTTGVTKVGNLGTGGASGSTCVVNISSATAGAGGTTVVNTPTVTFANAVTQVGMPHANLTAQLLGLGGATADSYTRLSLNWPAGLLNNAGAGIEAMVNKAAPAIDAAFAFKSGFSARALTGLFCDDDFSFKVSPDGSRFFEAIRIDRSSSHVEMPQPAILPGLSTGPSTPPAGKAAVYAPNRARAPWIDVMQPWGRDSFAAALRRPPSLPTGRTRPARLSPRKPCPSPRSAPARITCERSQSGLLKQSPSPAPAELSAA